MPGWLKILIGIIVSFVIIIVIGGIVFYHMLKRSLPVYEGKVNAASIQSDVIVYRDSMAIPYIVAKDEDDAAFALGYVHAQDRIFSMDLMRRAGEGKLSEIFGTHTLPFDEMFRTVGIEKISENILEHTDPAVIKLLRAYSKGVNKYIKDAKGKYPVEFDVLGYDPHPWRPVDCIVIGRMMAWELNVSWWSDITFTRIIQKFGEAKAKEIFPNYPDNAPVIIPPEIKKYSKLDNGLIKTDKAFREFMGMTGTHLGSNNWVVDAKMSASGKPIIANDTHLHYTAPSTWFAAVIRSDKWNAEGFTLPGVPAVVIGRNKNISWTVTNVMLDDADFYIEKIDSSGKNYLYNNKWEKLKSYYDTIKVKDSSDVILKISSTVHGPLVSGIHLYNLLYPGNKFDTTTISMDWLGDHYSNEMYSFYQINRAKNWNEFKNALSSYSVPAQNFVYADEEGNIGYVFGGKIPVRDNSSISFVYDGTTSKYDWKGFVSQNELPSFLNPKENYIATANNKTEKNFKYYISDVWEPPSRIERIEKLLTQKNKHSIHDYMNYQMDIVSPYAEKITQYILNAFKGIEITDKNLKLTLQLLKDWNFKFNQYSQVPAIYAVFFNHLLKNIYYDEMGHNLFNEFVFVANVPYNSVLKVLSDSTNSWIDDITTPRVETKDEIIRKSLADALTELENNYGGDLKMWQWGKMHKVIFKHAFSGISSLLDKFINIGPFEIGGDGTTIFNTEYPFYESIKQFPQFSHSRFENILGPAMRYIFDFAKPDQFYMILTTGESGNILSKHYKDMSKMWLTGKYLKIKTDDASIRKNKNQLVLRAIH
jgi:penicillin amidase